MQLNVHNMYVQSLGVSAELGIDDEKLEVIVDVYVHSRTEINKDQGVYHLGPKDVLRIHNEDIDKMLVNKEKEVEAQDNATS